MAQILKQGIVVSTSSRGAETCTKLLKSIWNSAYSVLIVIDDPENMSQEWWSRLYAMSGEMMWHVYEQKTPEGEIGALKIALLRTIWEEFIVLTDDKEVDTNFRVFQRRVLEKMLLPTTMVELVSQYEGELNGKASPSHSR